MYINLFLCMCMYYDVLYFVHSWGYNQNINDV